MQQIIEIEKRNFYVTNWGNINEHIIKDRNLSFSAKGLLIEILQLPKKSTVCFQDLYSEAGNEKDKEELVRAFNSLHRGGYIHYEHEQGDREGPVRNSRYAPFVLILTDHAKRLRAKY